MNKRLKTFVKQFIGRLGLHALNNFDLNVANDGADLTERDSLFHCLCTL